MFEPESPRMTSYGTAPDWSLAIASSAELYVASSTLQSFACSKRRMRSG